VSSDNTDMRPHRIRRRKIRVLPGPALPMHAVHLLEFQRHESLSGHRPRPHLQKVVIGIFRTQQPME
jgi:hypothetical protein